MKKKGKAEDGTMRAEYAFSKETKNPYAKRANAEGHLAVIDADLHHVFPSSEAVNNALRLIVKASTKAIRQAKAD